VAVLAEEALEHHTGSAGEGRVGRRVAREWRRGDQREPAPIRIGQWVTVEAIAPDRGQGPPNVWVPAPEDTPSMMDEFYAGAYAGFVEQPALLKAIIAFYTKLDDKAVATELLTPLATVGKPKAYERPMKRLPLRQRRGDAQTKLTAVKPPPEFTNGHTQARQLAGTRTPPRTAPPDPGVNPGRAARLLHLLADTTINATAE
jgi:hypothetical protein